MGKEKGPDFYTGKGYLKKGKYESNLLLYDSVYELLPNFLLQPHIIDLGCGIGYFAKLLYEKGYRKYTGIDFSSKVIEIAKKQVPNFDFICSNLLDKKLDKIYKNNEVFTILETLEHIEKDIKVLNRISKGSIIIISVPNKDYISHVRFFKCSSEVVKRYNDLIEFDTIKTIETNSKKKSKIFILKGIRR